MVIELGSIVQTSEGVYYKGQARSTLSEPITGVYTIAEVLLGQYNTQGGYIDALDGANYNRKAQTLSKFKTIFSAYFGKLFAINATNKGYFIGADYFGTGGTGLGCDLGTSYTQYHSRPTPIATGIGDDTNPNPLY